MNDDDIFDELYKRDDVRFMIEASIKASVKPGIRPSIQGLLGDPSIPMWTKNWIRELEARNYPGGGGTPSGSGTAFERKEGGA